MKTLYLVRHAEAGWDKSDLKDFDRPLTEHGRAEAAFVGSLLRTGGLLFDVIVCSVAVRARETATLLCKAAGFAGESDFDERIYEANTNRLVEVASGIDAENGSVMLVGHNPGMESLVRYLTGEIEPMPTAAIAQMELDVDDWSSIHGGCGRLISIIRPADEMVL